MANGTAIASISWSVGTSERLKPYLPASADKMQIPRYSEAEARMCMRHYEAIGGTSEDSALDSQKIKFLYYVTNGNGTEIRMNAPLL